MSCDGPIVHVPLVHHALTASGRGQLKLDDTRASSTEVDIGFNSIHELNGGKPQFGINPPLSVCSGLCSNLFFDRLELAN